MLPPLSKDFCVQESTREQYLKDIQLHLSTFTAGYSEKNQSSLETKVTAQFGEHSQNVLWEWCSYHFNIQTHGQLIQTCLNDI
jgi:hypothetical protein